MARGSNNTKNENKTESAKPTKALSPKRQLEADHLSGKHKENSFGDCGFCNRRSLREMKKTEATKRYLLSQKK